MLTRQRSRRCSAEPLGDQVEEDRRVVDQVAAAEPARAVGQAVQPFEAGPAHPDGGAGVDAGAVFQGGADAQAGADAAGLQRDGVGQQFLYRGADREEGESRAARHREVAGAAEGRVVMQQVGRRGVVQEGEVRVARAQRRDVLVSTAAEKCARWRRKSVPVGLIKKGLEALLIDARCEPRGA
jgi:hypothetical protein